MPVFIKLSFLFKKKILRENLQYNVYGLEQTWRSIILLDSFYSGLRFLSKEIPWKSGMPLFLRFKKF